MKVYFLRNIVHGSCVILESHQQCTKIPISSQPRQHLYLLIFLFFFIFFLFFYNDRPKNCEVALHKSLMACCSSWGHRVRHYWETDLNWWLVMLSIFSYTFSFQFRSVTQWCATLCDPMDYSMPGFPVYHQLPELAQIHVHWVSDAIQNLILCRSPPSFNISQHQGLDQWVGSSHQVAKESELQLQHQTF